MGGTVTRDLLTHFLMFVVGFYFSVFFSYSILLFLSSFISLFDFLLRFLFQFQCLDSQWLWELYVHKVFVLVFLSENEFLFYGFFSVWTVSFVRGLVRQSNHKLKFRFFVSFTPPVSFLGWNFPQKAFDCEN